MDKDGKHYWRGLAPHAKVNEAAPAAFSRRRRDIGGRSNGVMEEKDVTVNMTFSLDQLKTVTRVWRDATDMKIPVADQFRIHFMVRRAALLAGFENAANGFLLMMQCMKNRSLR